MCNSDDVLAFLKLALEIFPLPKGDEEGPFRGTHGITAHGDYLELGIWFMGQTSKKVKIQSIYFEAEPLNKATLLDIKQKIDEIAKDA